MGSLYLSRLSYGDYEKLRSDLCNSQNAKCFICDEPVDLILHKDSLDIDHIIPTKLNGPDNPTNFALTHSSCNRSKQASDLNVARILAAFDKAKSKISDDSRGINLDDVLKNHQGSKYEISFNRMDNSIKYSLHDIGDNSIYQVPIYKDKLSGFEYFFVNLPIEYLFHDDKINPRSIGQNISKLVQEFYLKRPQLHISLSWIDLLNGNKSKVKIFDGQHKAAAQILLGVRNLPVRVFINPDPDVLLTTNTNAGTTLRQVAFDKSVQRHLGSALYIDRVVRYKNELGLKEDDYSFSEKDLLKYFKGESREVKRYILDAVRDSITHNQENKLKDYIDFGGRFKEKPLSYSTIEKSFYSFFILQDALETPLDHLIEQGENPRELEKDQILELMNIIAEEVYIGKFDPDLGTSRIESKVMSGENIPTNHLIAFRMSKEEIIYNWLKMVQQIVKSYFIMNSKYIKEEKLFQYKFTESLWNRIRTFIKNLTGLSIWINKELANTVFGGKQNYDYWQTIFESGKTPQGLKILPKPLDLMEMIQEKND
jgi:hypothetical protein